MQRKAFVTALHLETQERDDPWETLRPDIYENYFEKWLNHIFRIWIDN